MISRLFDGIDDYILLPFGFFYGSTMADGDAASFGIWISSPDASGSYVALISSDAASAGASSNVGWGLYWKNDELKVRYWYGGGAGTLEELSAPFSTPVDTPVFIAVTVSVAGGVPTWKFYAGATPSTVAQVGSSQVGTGVPRANARRLAIGCRTTGASGSQTTDGFFFEGYVERVGYNDGEEWTLDELKWFARTGAPQTVDFDPSYEGNGVGFDFTGDDPELDSGSNFWETDLITGTTVEAAIAPQVWRHVADLWTDSFPYPSPMAFIALDGDELLLGGSPNGQVWKSFTLGETWAEQDPLASQDQCNCLLYLGSDVVLAGSAFTTGKIFKSTDGGETWTDKGQLGTSNQVTQLCLMDNGDVLAGTGPNGKIFRSTDDGETWSEVEDIAGETHIATLLSLGGTNALAGAGNNNVYETADGGDTWSLLSTLPGDLGFVNHLFRVPATDKILACTDTGVIAYSDDLGATWTQKLSSDIHNLRLFIGPVDGRYLCIAENQGYVFQSENDGETWDRLYAVPIWTSNSSGLVVGAKALIATGDFFLTGLAMIWELTTAAGDGGEPPEPAFLLTVDRVWRNLEYRYFGDPQEPEVIDPRVQILGATDLLQIAELGGYFDMHYVKSWTELDRWELTLDADAPDGQSLLALGVVPSATSYILQVLINNVFDFAGIVESTEIKFADGRTTYVLKGNGIDKILADKLAIPPTGLATDSYDDIAENVMRAVVDVNLINPQATDVTGLNEAQRAVDLLDQTPNLSAGATVEVEARNQTVFDVVREAALQDGELGFQILISAGALLFDVFEGVDRSAYLVFALNRDNLKNLSIKHDQSNYSTHLIMGGQGEGASRALACAFLGVPPTGINRKERFQDAREIADDLKLQARGQSILRTEADYVSLEGERLQVSYPQYKVDFELGDLITFSAPEYEISVVKRVVEVDVTIAQGRPLEVRVSLGKARARQNNMILRNSLQATSRS